MAAAAEAAALAVVQEQEVEEPEPDYDDSSVLRYSISCGGASTAAASVDGARLATSEGAGLSSGRVSGYRPLSVSSVAPARRLLDEELTKIYSMHLHSGLLAAVSSRHLKSCMTEIYLHIDSRLHGHLSSLST